jgi:hypothetical protein
MAHERLSKEMVFSTEAIHYIAFLYILSYLESREASVATGGLSLIKGGWRNAQFCAPASIFVDPIVA